MRFLIAVQGSYGDINPCAAIGVGLHERGHEVVFLASGYYQEWLQRLGLETVPTISREEHLRIIAHPDFTHPVKAYRLAWDLLIGAGKSEYETIQERFEPGRTIVITRVWDVGPRIAAEKLGVPLLYFAVAPDELGILSGADALKQTMLSKARRKLRMWVIRRFDRRINRALNQLRHDLGLPLVERWFSAANYLPQSILALFPEWYAPPKPEWLQIQYAGFPLFDGRMDRQLIEGVEQFLAEGDAPIIITTASTTQAAREYFQSAVSAVERIGVRAVLLSSFPGNVPQKLPASIGYFGYVPLQLLLPRSLAIMHHGGTGTVAGALHAGIPQLIVPVKADNALHGIRVRQMGVGSVLRRGQCQPHRIAREIETLIASPRIRERCSHYAAKLRTNDGIELACRIIEDHCRQLSRPGLTNSKSAGRSAQGAY